MVYLCRTLHHFSYKCLPELFKESYYRKIKMFNVHYLISVNNGMGERKRERGDKETREKCGDREEREGSERGVRGE